MHPSEEELVLYYYGEEGAPPAIADHLAACPECRAAYAVLQRVLNVVETAPAPEPPAGYEARVWKRLVRAAPLPRRAPATRFHPRRWAAAAAMAVLLAAAFLAGRWTPRAPQQPTPPATSRVLLMAVGDHLERSQVVLIEVVNSGDLSAEQRRAEDLVGANRLYRNAAAAAGETGLAAVLAELERVLLDIARGPVSPEELERIRRRVEAQGILFKVRVLESEVRHRQAL